MRSPSAPCSITGMMKSAACPSWPGLARPSTSSCVAKTWMPAFAGMTYSLLLLRQFALVVLVVELRVHAVLRAVALERLDIFLGDVGVLHPIRDGRAAFVDVHGGVVDVLLAGRAGLAAGIVRAEPGGEPQRFLRGAEMLVEPARAAGRCRHHADRLIVDTPDLVLLAVLPGVGAEPLGPCVGVAFALDADQHGRRGVRMRFRIAPILVLADPQVERVAGHERLGTAGAGRAAGWGG